MLSPIPTTPAKAGKSQTDHIPATFLRTSMRAGAEVPWVQSHRNHQTGGNRSQYPWGAINTAQSCRAIATTFRVTSQLSNLHRPGVGISNKYKIILAQNIEDVKLFEGLSGVISCWSVPNLKLFLAFYRKRITHSVVARERKRIPDKSRSTCGDAPHPQLTT